MRVLGLIPARGNSKGVPRKNLRLLAGKPLVQYSVEAALAARRVARVVLSTEDAEIAETARACGALVPFLRPAELAADDTPMLLVVEHALHELEATGDRFDAVCLLQPTSPFRRPEEIDQCIDLLEQTGADSVVTVRPVPPKYNPHWVYFADSTGVLRLSTGEAAPLPRRQALPPAFHRDGSVYVTRREVVLERHTLYGSRVVGFQLQPEPRVNIDTWDDWLRAEAIAREQT
jgi:CMP-N,N'-diacetyllegionaminic acid synthase